MTEAITTGLGQISALNVITRSSVLLYRENRKTMPEIARGCMWTAWCKVRCSAPGTVCELR